MPTYEYECTKCGAVTEVYQSMKDAPRRKLKKEDAPQCRCNVAVTRRIGTGAGIIFKGSGFYTTDYRSESYKQAAKADQDSGKTTPKKDGDTASGKSTDAGTTTPSKTQDGKSSPAAKKKSKSADPTD